MHESRQCHVMLLNWYATLRTKAKHLLRRARVWLQYSPED